AAVSGSVVHKMKVVDTFGVFGALALPVVVFEIIAERIGGQTQQQSRRARAFERFNCPQMRGIEQSQSRQSQAGPQGGFEEISTCKGLHGPTSTTVEEFGEPGFVECSSRFGRPDWSRVVKLGPDGPGDQSDSHCCRPK